MTTTNTTQENNRQPGLHLTYLLLVGVFVMALLTLAGSSLRKYFWPDGLQVKSAVLPQAPEVTGAELYIMEQGWDGYNHVLVIDPNLGDVNRRFEAGYNSAVKLTADQSILYIYRQRESGAAKWPDLFVTGIASAIETRTGAVLWQVDIPGSLFGSPTKGAWLSMNEQRLYLQGNPGIGVIPQIFVVDTRTGTLLQDFELSLPYPSNVDEAFPLTWKLPWDEMLVVVSRDQLFTFDLTSGKSGNAISLFDPGSIQRLPLNLPHTTYVQSGALDPETRQLFLATSTQEILAVDLNTPSFTVTSVVALPSGWQYATTPSILYYPVKKAVYIQVKHSSTPRIDGLEAEEVWVYDTSTWTRQARLNLREQPAKAPFNLTDNDAIHELTNYGLALSPNGQNVYSISRIGLLEITQDASNRLQGAWLNISWEDPDSFAWKFTVP